jgi:glycosyltransferase involved in cell wall biosynthesis
MQAPDCKTPKCSIVIPTRDCLPYLNAALMSVAAQDILQDVLVETIVVDDGSSDGTRQWLDAQNMPNLRIITQNGIGPARARNLAIEAARGALIAFLDADDFWWPGKLRAQMEAHATHPDAAFSFSDYLHFDPDGALHGTGFEFWSYKVQKSGYHVLEDAEATLLGANLVGASTVMARRDMLLRTNGFATSLPSAEDWDLWLRLASMGEALVSGAVTTSYLMRPGGETAKRGARIAAMEMILSRYANRSGSIAHASAKARGRLCAGQAEWARERGEPWNALGWRARAWRALHEGRLLRAAASDVLAGMRQGAKL